MTCETTRAVIQATADGDWPPGVAAHLATCDACVEAAIDRALRQRPAGTVPASFAVDVARRARVYQEARPTRSRGLLAGVATGSAVAAGLIAWVAWSDASGAGLPSAALMLAVAETVVLSAWATQGGVVRSGVRAITRA
jgi:hypothetical protein